MVSKQKEKKQKNKKQCIKYLVEGRPIGDLVNTGFSYFLLNKTIEEHFVKKSNETCNYLPSPESVAIIVKNIGIIKNNNL